MIGEGFHLHWPWVFLLLPLPWLAARLLPAARPEGVALLVPFFQNLQRITQGHAAKHPRHILWLGWSIWLLLVVAAAQPQWVEKPIALPTTGRDMLLAVDISGSMKQEDFTYNGRKISRLLANKAVGGDFLQRRVGDRVGLILFGTQAYLQAPLTFDRKTVAHLLMEAEVGLAGEKTAIGDAVGLAIKHLRKQQNGQRVLVLLTDGSNTAGETTPAEAAKQAAAAGVRIQAIGVGSPDPVAVQTFFGVTMTRPSDLDETTLKEMAEATGGRYFRAEDTDRLSEIYQLLDRLEPTLGETESYQIRIHLFPWFLGAALILSLLLAVHWGGGVRMAGRGGVE